MTQPAVFLEVCREYDVKKLGRIFSDGLAFLGVELPRQSKVLVKPNVLSACRPDQHITTHPVVVEAVVELLVDGGNEVVVADSSCLPGRTAKALEKTGLAEIGQRFGKVKVMPLEEATARPYADGGNKYLKVVHLSGMLDEVECIVNVPKLKSHTLVRFTGAVKNFLGCVPGGGKQQAHILAPTGKMFSQLLVDLYGFIKPKIRLNVMDGVVGLDGFGPGPTGRINPAGFVGLSADAVALDMACCDVMRADPMSVWTNRFAVECGLGVHGFTPNQRLDPVRFKLPRSFPVPACLARPVSRIQQRRPVVDSSKCRKCGICAEVCPAKCIAMDEYPRWDYSKCIYCYCCHECCPHAAINLKRSLSLIRS
ncbi:MAG TPA: DUF362 domain-containing protein [Candidatus Hydrogenedentes bacterium]|mgnify:CR=1 FL=1|nr:DUF362 domain-containing protein [Candidatus Hydrogenedentota bacterium]HPG70253.1 DUF362 domain-containing protein [Candidatus Hydrogenedentota bacterium]